MSCAICHREIIIVRLRSAAYSQLSFTDSLVIISENELFLAITVIQNDIQNCELKFFLKKESFNWFTLFWSYWKLMEQQLIEIVHLVALDRLAHLQWQLPSGPFLPIRCPLNNRNRRIVFYLSNMCFQ